MTEDKDHTKHYVWCLYMPMQMIRAALLWVAPSSIIKHDTEF